MTTENLIFFDLEISRIIPENAGDWSEYRPFGISCAATMAGDEIQLWHGDENGRIAHCMSVEQCQDLAFYLYDQWVLGAQIVTWNGLGFDFDVLAEECKRQGWHDNMVDLALSHIDIAFAMFCDLGYMCSLDRAAEGMKIPGKVEGMGGGLTPVMWAGSREEQEAVLEYVAQDARVTRNLYEEIVTAGYLRWITQRGHPCKRPWYPHLVDGRLATVSESLEKPAPDTSWMDSPWSREKFLGWTTA